MLFLLLIALSYMFGSVPFGKLVGRRHGIDIQKHGSGNIGFANTARVLGLKRAWPVLGGDLLKGAVPVALAVATALPEPQLLAVAAAAVIGHIFPIWLKFNGGKGIATGLGIMLVLDPLLVAIAVAEYLGLLAATRVSAVASLSAAWSIPLLCLWLHPDRAWFYAALAALITWAHRSNVRQFLHWEARNA